MHTIQLEYQQEIPAVAREALTKSIAARFVLDFHIHCESPDSHTLCFATARSCAYAEIWLLQYSELFSAVNKHTTAV